MNAATRILDRAFMPGAPAERLGMVRAWVGAYAFIYLCIRAPHLTSFAWMDAHYFRPVGLDSSDLELV